MAQWAAFWPDMNMAPKVGPIRGAPSSSATCDTSTYLVIANDNSNDNGNNDDDNDDNNTFQLTSYVRAWLHQVTASVKLIDEVEWSQGQVSTEHCFEKNLSNSVPCQSVYSRYSSTGGRNLVLATIQQSCIQQSCIQHYSKIADKTLHRPANL